MMSTPSKVIPSQTKADLSFEWPVFNFYSPGPRVADWAILCMRSISGLCRALPSFEPIKIYAITGSRTIYRRSLLGLPRTLNQLLFEALLRISQLRCVYEDVFTIGLGEA